MPAAKTIGMEKRHEAVAGTVEKLLGNPISRALIRIVSSQTEHGSRLDLALKNYAGEGVPDELDLRGKRF